MQVALNDGQEFMQTVFAIAKDLPEDYRTQAIEPQKIKPSSQVAMETAIDTLLKHNPYNKETCKDHGSFLVCDSLSKLREVVKMDAYPVRPTVYIIGEATTTEYSCSFSGVYPETPKPAPAPMPAPKAPPVPEAPSWSNFWGYWGETSSEPEVQAPEPEAPTSWVQMDIECTGRDDFGNRITLKRISDVFHETLVNDKEGTYSSRQVIPGEPLELHEEFFNYQPSTVVKSLMPLTKIAFPGLLASACALMALKDWSSALRRSKEPLLQVSEGDEVQQAQSSRLGAALSATAWTACTVALGCLTFAAYKNSNPLENLKP